MATSCEELTHWKRLGCWEGLDWGQEEKGTTEDEMAGWHHQLNEYEFEQILGDSEAWHDAVHGVIKSVTT